MLLEHEAYTFLTHQLTVALCQKTQQPKCPVTAHEHLPNWVAWS
jgi:hypothetical protein